MKKILLSCVLAIGLFAGSLRYIYRTNLDSVGKNGAIY